MPPDVEVFTVLPDAGQLAGGTSPSTIVSKPLTAAGVFLPVDEYAKTSRCKVFSRIVISALLPQVLVIPFMTLVPLHESTPHWENSQIGWNLHLVAILCAVQIMLPLALINSLDWQNPGFHIHTWKPGAISVVIIFVIDAVIPYSFGVHGAIPFLIWFLGPPLFGVEFAYLLYEFLHTHPEDELEAIANSVGGKRRMVMVLFGYANSFAFSMVALLGCLLIFVLQSAGSAWWQILIGSITGISSVSLRIVVPHIIFEVLNMPLAQHCRFHLSFFCELASELWFQLAFPQINSWTVFALVAVVEVLSIFMGSLWCLPGYSEWMATGDIQGKPTSHITLLKKIAHALHLYNPRAKHARDDNSLAIHRGYSEGRAGRSNIMLEQNHWRAKAADHLFLRLWAEILATLSFVCILSVAAFTRNGVFLPFDIDLQTWITCVSFSVIVLVAQIVVVQVATSTSTQKVSVFAQGYAMLGDSKFFLFSTTMNVAILLVFEAIFMEPANGLYNFYPHEEHLLT